MRTILVTGGAGFIGSNLVYYLAEKYPDDRIVVLDALTYAGSTENLPREMLSGQHPASELLVRQRLQRRARRYARRRG